MKTEPYLKKYLKKIKHAKDERILLDIIDKIYTDGYEDGGE